MPLMIDLSARRRVVICLFVVFVAAFLLLLRRDYTKETERLDSIILETARNCGAPDRNFVFGKQEIGKSGGHTFLKITRRYDLGPGFGFDKFRSEIEKRLRNTGFRIVKSLLEEDSKKEERTFYFSFKNRIVYEVSFLKKKYKRISKGVQQNAKIAIVLDDFGYS